MVSHYLYYKIVKKALTANFLLKKVKKVVYLVGYLSGNGYLILYIIKNNNYEVFRLQYTQG